MAENEKLAAGRCLCGAVRYEVRGALTDPHACHCNMCRRQSGHFVVGASAKRSEFELTAGESLKWYRSSDFARRGFCADCGSNLFWDDDSDHIGISVGTLNKPTGLSLAKHIYVEDKADYYEIDDNLPKFISYDTPA